LESTTLIYLQLSRRSSRSVSRKLRAVVVPTPNPSGQKKIPQFMNFLPRSNRHHKELVCALTEFVCLDMQPVSAVEGV